MTADETYHSPHEHISTLTDSECEEEIPILSSISPISPFLSSIISSYSQLSRNLRVCLSILFSVLLFSAILLIDSNSALIKWLNLPALFFSRILRSSIQILLFITTTLSIADYTRIHLSKFLLQRIHFYIFASSLIGSIEGIIFGYALSSRFIKFTETLKHSEFIHTQFHKATERYVQWNAISVLLKCANGKYLTWNNETNMVGCHTVNIEKLRQSSSVDFLPSIQNITSTNDPSIFNLIDMNYILTERIRELQLKSYPYSSMTEQIVHLFKATIPSSCLQAFVSRDIIGLIIISLVFGISIAKTGGIHENIPTTFPGSNYMLSLLRQINSFFVLLIQYFIRATSIICFFFVFEFLTDEWRYISYILAHGILVRILFELLCHFLVLYIVHGVVVMPMIHYVTVGSFPWKLLKENTLAFIFAGVTASSQLSFPIALYHTEKYFYEQLIPEIKKEKPDDSNSAAVYLPFPKCVLSQASILCRSGMAAYLTYATMFLIYSVDAKGISLADCCILAILATVGSVTCYPAPGISPFVVMSVYKAVHYIHGQHLIDIDEIYPFAFFGLVLIDALQDRIQTITNLAASITLCSFIALRYHQKYETVVKLTQRKVDKMEEETKKRRGRERNGTIFDTLRLFNTENENHAEEFINSIKERQTIRERPTSREEEFVL